MYATEEPRVSGGIIAPTKSTQFYRVLRTCPDNGLGAIMVTIFRGLRTNKTCGMSALLYFGFENSYKYFMRVSCERVRL